MDKNIIGSSKINIIAKFFSLGIIFLFQSLLSKYISVEDYSKFSKLLVYGNYGSLLFSFGLSASLLFFSKNEKDFITNYINIVFLYTFILILGIVTCLFIDIDVINKYIFTLSIVLNLITISLAYYQINHDFIKFAFWGLIQSLLILSIMLIILIRKITIEEIIFIYISIHIIYFVIIVYNIFKTYKDKIYFKINIDIEYIKYGIKTVFLMIISQFIYISDYLLIDHYLQDIYLSYYFIAMIISKIIFVIADTSGHIIYPILVTNKNDSDNIQHIYEAIYLISSSIFFIIIMIFIIFYIYGNYIIQFLYTDNYLVAYNPILMLILGTQGMIIYKLLSRKLAANNNWRPLYISVSIAAINNIFFNFILVPKYGISGAAFSSMISFWICGGMLLFFSKENLFNYLFFPLREKI